MNRESHSVPSATAMILRKAIATMWEELPALVGPAREAFESELIILLRELDSGTNQEEVCRRIATAFARHPAARQRLAQVMGSVMPAAEKGSATGLTLAIQEDRYVRVPVFFGTVRDRTDSDSPVSKFGGGRGELRFGIATVSIPDDHRMGKIEKPRWWRLEFRPDPERHVVLLSIEILEREVFVVAGREAASRARQPEGLVFVHGYNTGFPAAAERAAQLAYDLAFDGIPMLFSWASEGALASYAHDEANVRLAEDDFDEFMSVCATRLGLNALHVVAHSMGNRLVTEHLRRLDSAAAKDRPLKQVVFAAPDVDADTFRRLASDLCGRATRFTLYASSTDHALQASKAVHGYLRAGESGEGLVVVDGVDTIDATAVDTSLMGHAYYGDNRSVLSDLFCLIRDGHGPDQRFGLSSQRVEPGRYWIFRP